MRQRSDSLPLPNLSFAQRASGALGKTITVKLFQKAGECVFCYADMGDGEKVIQLACHVTHQFHEGCYNNFLAHFEQNQGLLLCPLCRTPVNKEAAVKKQLAIDPSAMKIEDAFGLHMGGPKVIDEVDNYQKTDQKLIVSPPGIDAPPQQAYPAFGPSMD